MAEPSTSPKKRNFSIADTKAIIESLDNPPVELQRAIRDAITRAQRGSASYQESVEGLDGWMLRAWNFIGPGFNLAHDYAKGIYHAAIAAFSEEGVPGEDFIAKMQNAWGIASDTRAQLSINRQMRRTLGAVETLTAEDLGVTEMDPGEFYRYKRELMLQTAKALGEQARKNGFPDTPDARTLLAAYDANSILPAQQQPQQPQSPQTTQQPARSNNLDASLNDGAFAVRDYRLPVNDVSEDAVLSSSLSAPPQANGRSSTLGAGK